MIGVSGKTAPRPFLWRKKARFTRANYNRAFNRQAFIEQFMLI